MFFGDAHGLMIDGGRFWLRGAFGGAHLKLHSGPTPSDEFNSNLQQVEVARFLISDVPLCNSRRSFPNLFPCDFEPYENWVIFRTVNISFL